MRVLTKTQTLRHKLSKKFNQRTNMFQKPFFKNLVGHNVLTLYSQTDPIYFNTAVLLKQVFQTSPTSIF